MSASSQATLGYAEMSHSSESGRRDSARQAFRARFAAMLISQGPKR